MVSYSKRGATPRKEQHRPPNGERREKTMAKITTMMQWFDYDNGKQIVRVYYESGAERNFEKGREPKTVSEWMKANEYDWKELNRFESEIVEEKEIERNPFGMVACMASVRTHVETFGEDPFEMLAEYEQRAKEDVFFNKTMIDAVRQYMEEHGIAEEQEEPEGLPQTEEEEIEDVTDAIAEFSESTEYAEYICDYGSSEYICDVFTYIADANTSIYWSDIIDFISKNVEMVSDTINEFGWEGCGSDLYKAGQMAEFRGIETELNENIVDVLKVYAFNYYREQYDEHIRTETRERISDHIDDHWGDFDTLEDIEEIVNEYASC